MNVLKFSIAFVIIWVTALECSPQNKYKDNQLSVHKFHKSSHRLTKLFRRVLNFLEKRKSKNRKAVVASKRNEFYGFHQNENVFKKFLENGSKVAVISTPKFTVKLTRKRHFVKNDTRKLFKKSNSTVKGNKLISGQRRSEFIVANDLDGALEETKSDFVGNESLYDIMNKLNKQRVMVSNHTLEKVANNVETRANSDVPLLKTFHSSNPRKDRLEKLFVRFLDDMTRKMGLDPLSIAHQLENLYRNKARRSEIQRARLKHVNK
ncbi:uncharacterized protein LOC105848581 [Hydra vulgaris]|uniref:Uncharacterized protein LOC105848581 n=1 Tax=Hydra vulgaris TaxID=6087 RepID=A0ABM4BF64_HYDVU